MDKLYGALILLILLSCGSAGCISSIFGEPTLYHQSVPPVQPRPESATVSVALSEIGLQIQDLPLDYILKERSVVAYEDIPPLARELGWRRGYGMTFFHLNKESYDLSGIVQLVSIYPLENMKTIYSLEKDDLLSRANSTTNIREIPFPVIGDRSAAFRITNTKDRYNTEIYTVIFTKKNVYEKLTFTGSTADYEFFREVAEKAADRIR
jgi:hypothetical protein